MKKWIALVLAILAAVCATAGSAEGPRGWTLRDGKYIVGEEIGAGAYTLTCIGTAGEEMGDAYSSLGHAFDALDGSGSDYSALFGSLGGMMEQYMDMTVEIVGDYGDVLRSYSMKTGDSMSIFLKEGTALRITDGSCTLVKAE